MSRATPGPWRADGFEVVGAEGTPDGASVCRLTYGAISPAPLADIGMPNERRATVAANAALIAASPALYDFAAKKAAEGDAEAAALVEAIHASR
jgi:hypothetical protein